MKHLKTNQKIRIGVIGVGQIGKAHIQTYQSIPEVEVVGIAGRNAQNTERVSLDFNIPFWTTNYYELLEREDIDAISVCLHNNLHQPVTVEGLKAGKHVYCEKPIAGSYYDALKMLETAHQTGKQLSIQLSTLFTSEAKAARAVIDKGWLGKPFFAFSSGFRRRGRPYVDGYGTPAFVQKSQAGGGALFDLGVYHIATLLYLLDNPAPIRISGRTYQETPMDAARQATSEFDVEEMALGFVQLERNITLNIIEAWAAHVRQLGGSYIVGSHGGIRLERFEIFQSLGDLDLNATADLERFESRLHDVCGQGISYDGPQQHWIEALRGNTTLLPTAEIALNTILISEGIYLSENLGREVTASEVVEMSQSTAVQP